MLKAAELRNSANETITRLEAQVDQSIKQYKVK
jgi:hypothetical protein